MASTCCRWPSGWLPPAAGAVGILVNLAESFNFNVFAEEDPEAMNGSVYTSLGCLYYQVPGWPLGFGDDAKARDYLQKALAINPDGIDPNYFHGDFLLEQGEYAAAERALDKALAAPQRPRRPVADAGRREEVRAALERVRKHLARR